MTKILTAISILSFSCISFAENIERSLRQIGPVPFLTVGTGSFLIILSVALCHIALSYGIFLLANKYEPKIHPIWSWIPFANIYPLIKVSKQPLWWIAIILLGSMVPVIGPIVTLVSIIFIYHKISIRTGRGAGMTALLTLFSVFTFPWLGLTVNKKSTKIGWIFSTAALVFLIIGTVLAGAGAIDGFLKLNRTHKFMDKAREEVMKEIQSNPSIREQIKNLEVKTNKADISKTSDTVTAEIE